MLQFTKNLLYRFNPKAAIYGELIIIDKQVLINGINHIVFEHKFIHAN